MISTARSAGNPCERCIQVFQRYISRVQGSIQQISSYSQPVDKLVQNIKSRSRNAHVIHMFDRRGTLSGESPSRAHREPLKRLARGVAFVIGIALSWGITPADGISNPPIQTVKQLADYQLTESQEYCHNQIIYRESRFKSDAINGSHYGYYQGKSEVLLDAPDDYQFYWYWSYVSNRYGVTRYDEPNYCKALHHLRVKGWQ